MKLLLTFVILAAALAACVWIVKDGDDAQHEDPKEKDPTDENDNYFIN